jgi:hypothetical protein
MISALMNCVVHFRKSKLSDAANQHARPVRGRGRIGAIAAAAVAEHRCAAHTIPALLDIFWKPWKMRHAFVQIRMEKGVMHFVNGRLITWLDLPELLLRESARWIIYPL